MSIVEIASGTARDVVRSGVLAGLRVRGDATGRLFGRHMQVDPYPTYDWLRSQGPVVRTDSGVISASHEFCSAVLRSPDVVTATSRRGELMAAAPAFTRWLFSSPDRTGLLDPLGPESMIGLDGPEHTRLRRVVSSVFTPSAVARLRPRVELIADELVDTAMRRPTFDLMRDVAGPLPLRVICELLGVPVVDGLRLRGWGRATTADIDALAPAHRQRAATRAMRDLEIYFRDLIARRRRHPGDDLLSRLIEVESEGGRLNERELVAMAILLLFAGFETTVNLIGNGTDALLRHPEQLADLAQDVSGVPAAIDELLRYDAPIQVVSRITTSRQQVAGVELDQGTMVSIMIGGANRDPDVFTDPAELDVRRPDARRHLSFSAGPHHCLGAALARLEAEVAFTSLLRAPGLRRAGTPRRRRTFVLRGFTCLPLTAAERIEP